MREGALALGRLLGAPPGAWGLPGPGPGPQPSSDEPDSRGGWSLPTLPRASSASSLYCRPLTTLVSDLVSALAMSSSFCARRPWRCEPSRPCPCLPPARATGLSCGGRQSTARWYPGRRSLVGRRGPQGVLQEGLRRVRPVQGVLPRPVVRLQGVHLVGVLQGVLMVLRQGVPVGLRRVASVGPRMGATS